jgi:DNA-binding transcriptional LysR family regulator
MRYSLRQLEVFVAIARLQSVSKAAGELSLSQSAASTALGELERQFDCQLFDRLGKRLRLNALGRELLPKASALLDRAAEIEELLRGNAGVGPLHIGATMTIGNYLAPMLVAAFIRRHPQSPVQLQVRNTEQIVQQIARCELDLGLIEGICEHPEIAVEPWLDDELIVFCAPDHPFARQGTAVPEELGREPWVLRESGSGTRMAFERAAREFDQPVRIALELEQTEAIKRAVESGLGLGCLSRLALRESFRRGSLVPVETPLLELTRQFFFIWHKHKYRTQGMQVFFDLCRALTAHSGRSDQLDLAALR